MKNLPLLRVGITGTPGSGKTTLSTKLAGSARDFLGINVVSLVQEYARTYISQYGAPTHLWEQVRILEKQESEENRVSQCDLLITDSPIQLGFLYSLELRDHNNTKDMMLLNDLFKMISKKTIQNPYDLIIHLPPLLKPIKDGIRADYQFDDKWRYEADQRIRFILDLFPPKKLVVLDPPLPKSWETMSELERKTELGRIRLTEAFQIIDSQLKKVSNG